MASGMGTGSIANDRLRQCTRPSDLECQRQIGRSTDGPSNEHLSAEPPSRRIRLLRLVRYLQCAAALCGCFMHFAVSASAQTLPEGGHVVAGSATITQPSPSQLDIHQQTDRAVIDWNSFSIGAGNRVDIQQPGAGSVSIQQVVGQSPSNIFGSLTSNGRVVIANPNGILVWPGLSRGCGRHFGHDRHHVDARDQDFMAHGKLDFDTPGGPNTSVVNDGMITVADTGLVAFVAPGVANSGVIQARLGKVQLVSGNRYTLDLDGDGLVRLAVDDKVLEQALGPDGKPLSAALVNSGKIAADGGSVYLTATAVKHAVDNVIDMSGVVEARGVQVAGGDIILTGGDTGTVAVTGTLDASAQGAGQTGGTVKILGNQVALVAGAKVDVSGSNGGGTALIGGNFHGAGPERNARTTYVDASATINADAVIAGNGGKVAVWADGATSFNGRVTARGGRNSGNGGAVETSGTSLGVGGSAVVDTSAAKGITGNWLLDPHNITIVSGGTALTNPTTWLTGGAGTDITISNTALNTSSNITLQANTDIFVNGAINNTNASRSLTMNAGRSIIFGASTDTITLNSGTYTATINDAGATAANRDAGQAVFNMNGASITTGGSTTQGGAGISITMGTFGGGGSINIGDITLGTLNTSGNSNTRRFGGPVTVANSAGGILGGGAISANGSPLPDEDGKGYAGGTITLSAGGPVNFGTVVGIGGPARGDNSTGGGSGSAITISGSTISIANLDASGGAGAGTTGAGSSPGGAGGTISVVGSADVTFGSITDTGGAANGTDNARAGGAGGMVTVTGTTVSTGTVNTSGGAGVRAGAGGAGGAISLTSNATTPTLTLTGGLTTTGGNSATGTAGNGGGVTLNGAVALNAAATTINARSGTGNGGSGGIVIFGTDLSVSAQTATNALTVTNTDAAINFAGTSYDFGTGGLTLTTTGIKTLANTVTLFNVPVTNTTYILPTFSLPAGTGALEFRTGAGTTLTVPALNFSSAARTVTFTADDISGSGAFTSAGSVNFVIRPLSSGRDVIFGLPATTAGHLNINSGTLSNFLNSGVASLTVGRNDLPSTMTIGSNTSTFPNVALPTVRFLTDGTLTVLSALSANAFRNTSFFLENSSLSGDITLAFGASITGRGASGDVVQLVSAGTFHNDSGSNTPITVDGGGRWLIWSQDPANDSRGSGAGIAYDFKQYNASFASTVLAQASGNGFLYAIAPTLSVSLTGTVSKTYDTTNVATLAAGNYTLFGAIDGDTATLNNPTTGAYDTINVGTGKAVSVGGITATATNGTATVYGYQLNSNASGAVGTITAAPVTVGGGFATADKVYDGTATATINAGDTLALSGVLGGDVVTLNKAAVFADKNVGTGKTVDLTGSTLSGAGAGNYALSLTGAPTTTADITAAPVTVGGGFATADKVYDGTATATINAGDTLALLGVLGGDVVTLNKAAVFADKNVGTGKTVDLTGSTLSGAGAGNYALSLTGAPTTTADITAAPVTVGGGLRRRIRSMMARRRPRSMRAIRWRS